MFETIRQTPAAAKIAQNTPQLNSNIDNLLRRRLSLIPKMCCTRSKQAAPCLQDGVAASASHGHEGSRTACTE
jgi:hypothetical protein